MNVRSVYMILLASVGLGLVPGLVKEAAADTGIRSVQDTIRQEQITDFHRRSLEDFQQLDVNVASNGFLATGLADDAVRQSNEFIRIQGRLAQWTIQEEHLVGFRTGMLARALAKRDLGVVAATASTDEGSPFGQAKELLKSARFEWPEFMPPALLR